MGLAISGGVHEDAARQVHEAAPEHGAHLTVMSNPEPSAGGTHMGPANTHNPWDLSR